MKKLLFVLCLGIFLVGGCGQAPTSTQNLPVLDASSPDQLVENLQTLSASVPADEKERFDEYVGFYTQYQFSNPQLRKKLAPKLDGKNYQGVLAALRANLEYLKEDFSTSAFRLSFEGVPEAATRESELSKIIITNLKYDKDTHVKEMDIENNSSKEISALQIMAREDFEPGSKHVAMFLVDFPPLKPMQKAHVSEVEDIASVQEMLAKRITDNMPAVAIQAFDNDKMLVLNNAELFRYIDMVDKLGILEEEIDRLLQL